MQAVTPQFIMDAALWLRDYVTAIRNGRVHPFSVVERKARTATRNQTWGPTGTMLAELAELSHEQEHCQVIFAVLEYRVRSPEHKWRCVYKALQVLEYLLQRGSPQCVTAAQELLVPLAALQNFAYVGPDQKDYGQNVRLRADAVKSLILDTEGLAQKRAQLAARSANMKFAGYSREDLAAGTAAAGPMAGVDSPPGQPVTPTPTHGSVGLGDAVAASVTSAAPETPAERPLSPSVYRPPSLFVAASATRSGQQQQRSAALRNAGETKGVTFEQNKRQLEQLRQLTLLEGNRTCADCASAVAAARPTWASINLGVFICMRCAGIHRGLGVHISKVRSTTLDTWLPEQVATMARLGNRRANTYFEAGLDPSVRPSRENTLELERFIRLKYADKAWAAKGTWPPEDDAVASVSLTHAGPAAAQVGSNGKQQPNGAAAPLPASTLAPAWEPTLGSSSWPHAAGSTGGGFGDAPPAWPSPTSSITPPSSSQPTQQTQQSQQQVPRLATPAAAPGARSGASGASVVRLLPPPPGSGPPAPGFVPGRFGAAAAAAAAGPQAATRDGGGVLSGSSTDLLQLDSDSEDEGEEGAGGSGGGGGNARGGAAGGPGSGAAALWDLLDPTMDVMTWLDRVEGAQQQQKQQPPQQPRAPVPQQQHLQQQPSHQRTPSAPVFGTFPTVAALPLATAPYHSPAAAHLYIETPALVQATPPSLGGALGAVSRAASATPAGGPVRLGVAESVILTAEFPVYDLLTPLPTGGGVAAPPPVTAAAIASVVARQYTTPPASSLSQAYPPVHPHHQAPNSAPSLQPPFTIGAVGGGGVSAAPLFSGAGLTASATTSAASTPPGHAAGVQRSSAGMLSVGMARSGSAMGLGTRGATAAQAPPAAAAAAAAVSPGSALDLDNLLAMQLDSLGSSLAGGTNGNGGVAGGGGGRPSWQPAAAVGSAHGGRR
ncbi:hypothetical protein PLESTB_000081200 [Pleodorina starrii]|uniref:Arf-GAP domain-containing protein n=1 Tax=Pleodorina starrii TaxID=330485 RepID=A0A9W6EXR8_9CHLO|nr:hypothetical protein PLESTM_000077600 [Pleodorina starrii]GLC48301.1 hypothetical protein PLESTB_000081200 [Pleodorina starrii]GLC66586.1 hypothetical protein PLESTF_000447000 [Pleodorina starrii]